MADGELLTKVRLVSSSCSHWPEKKDVYPISYVYSLDVASGRLILLGLLAIFSANVGYVNKPLTDRSRTEANDRLKWCPMSFLLDFRPRCGHKMESARWLVWISATVKKLKTSVRLFLFNFRHMTSTKKSLERKFRHFSSPPVNVIDACLFIIRSARWRVFCWWNLYTCPNAESPVLICIRYVYIFTSM